MRAGRGAFGALALVALLAACGGDGDDDDENACDPREVEVDAAPIVEGSASLRSIAVERAGEVLVAEVTTAEEATPLVLIDTDDDRDTGMWSLQSPISSSGWDVLVDEHGDVYTHSGTSTEWAWSPVAKDARTGWTASETGVLVCLGPATADAAGIDTGTMRISAFLDADQSLPAPFLPGAAWPRETVVQPEEPREPVEAEPLAFAYGREPWRVGGCTTPACAAARYAGFAHVVMASGMEDPAHPSHAGAVELIAALRALAPSTEVWGYVSHIGGPVIDGARTFVYTPGDIGARAAQWQAIGATGIFLDEADLCRAACGTLPDGSELVADKSRQNAVIDAIHALGMPVFANGFAPEDILGEVDGSRSALRAGDAYLLESPTFSGGSRMAGIDALSTRARYLAARRYTAASGIRLAAVDTWDGAVADGYRSDPRWDEARATVPAATIHGITNVSYSASPELSDNLPRP